MRQAEKLLGEALCGWVIFKNRRGDTVVLGARSRFKVCDVTKEEQVEALVQSAVDEFGRIDVMFNNAGIVGALGPLESTTAEEWQFTLDILLNGVFYGMKHASKHMKKARSGSMISMSSVAGVTGGLGPHAYAAAKHAVVGITRNLAQKSAHSVSG